VADETTRAETSESRGKQAARMIKSGSSMDKVRSYISEQGDKEAAGRQMNATIGKAAGYKSDPASYKRGGKVKRGGQARVHKGERILTRKQDRKYQRKRSRR
jgi:hypothetical protein